MFLVRTKLTKSGGGVACFHIFNESENRYIKIYLIVKECIVSSISIKSSWVGKSNYPIIIPRNVSRVPWNGSSTASLEGNRFHESQIRISWITNQDFLLADTSAMDSDSMDYFKYGKEWVFSGKVCWNCCSTAQKRPEALCSRPYKQISKIFKQKNYMWG